MCQRRLCPRRQHQIGHCAARTNAFPASGAHAGVRTTAPLLVYALIYGLCSSRRPFTPSGYWLVNERSTSTLSLRSPPCEELSSLLLHSDVSLIFWYLSQGRGGTVPCVSAFAAHSKRSIASLLPRLGVLNNIPFATPFEAHVNIFRSLILNKKHRHTLVRGVPFAYTRYHAPRLRKMGPINSEMRT